MKERGYWAISGYSAKTEPENWDLENQTRQKQALKGLEQEGPQEAGSKGPVWWQEMRSFRPSRQESRRLEHKNCQRCLLTASFKRHKRIQGKNGKHKETCSKKSCWLIIINQFLNAP